MRRRSFIDLAARWFAGAALLFLFPPERADAQRVDAANSPRVYETVTSVDATGLAARGEIIVKFRTATVGKLSATAAGFPFGELEPLGRSRAARGVVAQNVGAAPASAIDSLFLLRLDEGANTEEAIRKIERHASVAHAEPNYLVRLAALPDGAFPDDLRFPDMWHLDNVGQIDGEPGIDIDAPEAWSIATGALDVLIAVIDTGVDFFHPDLRDNLWTNTREIPGNGVDDDGNGYVDDVHGFDFVSDDGDPMDDVNHGTHVGGTIGAIGNNRQGVTGVLWDARMMAVKAFGTDGNSRVSDIIRAIEYATANGAGVINASWGSDTESRAMREVIEEATAQGIVFIAAAGNDKTSDPFYPASFEDTLSVGAIETFGKRATFSNYGDSLDIAAPGQRILSTYPNNNYGTLNGTSMAAPQATATAALIRSRHSSFSSRDVMNVLKFSTTRLDPGVNLGTGLLNVHDALLFDSPPAEVDLQIPETIYGIVPIRGSAYGIDFAEVVVSFGEGSDPEEWTEIGRKTSAVIGGELIEAFDTSVLPEGEHTIRAVASNSAGILSEVRQLVNVSNVHIRSPMNNDVHRAGDLLEITGTVFGRNRTYTIEHAPGIRPTEWSTSGITPTNQRGVDQLLATWDTSQAEPDSHHALRLTATDDQGNIDEVQVVWIYLDSFMKRGWPYHVPISGEYPTMEWRTLKAVDLNGDGTRETVFVDPGYEDTTVPRLVALRADGSTFVELDLPDGEPRFDIPAIGDLDGDGIIEIVTAAGGRLQEFRFDGSTLVEGWVLNLPSRWNTKVMDDLDRDGSDELVVFRDRGDSGELSELIVIDGDGSIRRSWEINTCGSFDPVHPIFPIVGNLDEDPEHEIVVVSGCDSLAMHDLTESEPVWRKTFNAWFATSPVMGDIDGDGANEIVITSTDNDRESKGGIHILRTDGRPLAGWPVLVEESFESSPVVADFDGDRQLEIAAISRREKNWHLLRANGFELDGWPLNRAAEMQNRAYLSVGDADGDGVPDLIMNTSGLLYLGVISSDLKYQGGLLAASATGQVIDLNPHPSLQVLPTELSGGLTSLKSSSPLLTDLDGNGLLDIVIASAQDVAEPAVFGGSPVRKNRSSIYARELPVPFVPERFPWPGFQRSTGMNGRFDFPPHVNVGPTVISIPDQIIPPGGTFLPIDLSRHVADPDHLSSEIQWSFEVEGELRVHLNGATAQVSVPDPGWIGSATIVFTATDPDGASATGQARFEVREGYVPPPVADLQFRINEDEPLVIDVFAPLGDVIPPSLSVLQVDRPARGSAEKSGPGLIAYTPERDFNGFDSFTYVVTTSDGGLAIGTIGLEIAPVPDAPNAAPDQISLDEDSSITLDPTANDIDADGDIISLVGWENAAHGEIVPGPRGGLNYRPDPDFSGKDTFIYMIRDTFGLESEGIVSIRVVAVNDVPTVEDLEFTTRRTKQVNAIYKGNDPDGDKLEYSIIQTPDSGTIFDYPSLAEYHPEEGFFGTIAFTYVATDGKSTSDEASITINVIDENNPPSAKAKTYRTLVNQSIDIELTATDEDGDEVEFEITHPPARGSITGEGEVYVYTPDADYLGSDSIRYLAFDGKDVGADARVSITVTDVNTEPTVESSTVTTRMDTPVTIQLEGRDGEGTRLSYIISDPPLHGIIEGEGSELLYTPDPGYLGGDRIRFHASDGELVSETAGVYIRVRFPNDPPVTSDFEMDVRPGTPTPIQLRVFDPDGDAIETAIFEGVAHGLLFGQGTEYTYVPEADFEGEDSFTFKAWDGFQFSALAEVTLNVRDDSGGSKVRIAAIETDSDGVTLRLASEGITRAMVQESEDLIGWSDTREVEISGADAEVFITFDEESLIRFYRVLILE